MPLELQALSWKARCQMRLQLRWPTRNRRTATPQRSTLYEVLYRQTVPSSRPYPRTMLDIDARAT